MKDLQIDALLKRTGFGMQMKPKNGFSDNTRKERSQIRRITMSNRTGKETGTQWK